MKFFKNKWFNHWARKEKILDAVLIEAVGEIIQGKVEANLGGCLFKKRLPRAGAGKSGGYRVLVGYRENKRIIFLYAFAKNKRANISDKEKEALKIVAESFMSSTEQQLFDLLEEGSILEVKK